MSRDGVAFGDWLIPEDELEESFDTSGGPGGQHANRNETAVTLRIDLSDSSLPDDIKARLIGRLGKSFVVVTSSDSRSQWRNRALARQRLASILDDANKEPTTRRQTRPTWASKKRRIEEKRRRSDIKRKRTPPEDW